MKLACLLLVVLVPPAMADTIKVNPSMPQDKIQDAIDSAVAGDTVEFLEGVYLLEDSLTLTTDGVTLKGSKAVLDGQYEAQYPLHVNANEIVVMGFLVRNASDDGIFVGPDVEDVELPDGVTVRDNVVEACNSYAISVLATNATITGNRTNGNNGAGIALSDSYDGRSAPSVSVIHGNRVSTNDGFGMEVLLANSGRITKNTILTSGMSGLCLEVRDQDAEGAGGPGVIVSRNVSVGSGTHGIVVINETDTTVHVTRNTVRFSDEHGLHLEGSNFLVEFNKSSHNGDSGVYTEILRSTIVGNSIKKNRQRGLDLRQNFNEPGPSFNRVLGNLLKENARDGIAVHTGGNDLVGNRCLKNLGDGIDIWSDDLISNLLLRNVCLSNAHEGIDNSGTLTDIVGNTAKKNAAVTGPDIAGAGDFGFGSVGAFEDNDYDTGGEHTVARLDNPDDS